MHLIRIPFVSVWLYYIREVLDDRPMQLVTTQPTVNIVRMKTLLGKIFPLSLNTARSYFVVYQTNKVECYSETLAETCYYQDATGLKLAF